MKKVLSILLSICMVFGLFAGIEFSTEAAQAAISSSDFLKANGKNLRNNYGNGDVVQLKGTNAGGYLIQEFWMTITDSTSNVSDEDDIYRVLTERFGESGMEYLIDLYQDNYWTETDFDNCAAMGMNCIRLPFWYKNLLQDDGSLDFSRLDWFVQEAGERGMYVIIDFHGAPGSQNGSDHSGIDGGNNKQGASAFFWGSSASGNQQLYYDMWYQIAQHFAGNPTVAAYDLLNEPYCTYRYNSGYSDDYLRSMLWEIYNNAYNVIRSVDADHVIIMEATWDPVDLPNPSQYGWSNIMYEYHNYLYDDYDNANGQQIANMQKKIDAINAANYNVPSYMGEFCYFNNLNAWDEGLALLTNAGISWTSWTYKVISDYGNWGLYNQTNQHANIETDSWDTLCTKFSKVGESWANTGLVEVMKKYLAQATVSGGSSSGSSSSTVSNGAYYLAVTDSNNTEYVVCAENTGAEPLIANRTSCGGAWETLKIENNGDGTVALKSAANDLYVCAVIDENCQLLARSSSVSTWEKFYLVQAGDGKFGLKAVANDKYVCADFNNGGQLRAISDSVAGSWEAFSVYTTSGIRVTSGSGGNSGSSGVTMYTDSNYNGTAVTFGVGEYNMDAMIGAGIGNDSISSIKVASGYEVIAYADIHFGGNSTTFTGEVSYVGNSWNDQITSFKVVSTNAGSSASTPVATVSIAEGEYFMTAVDSNGTEYVVCAENTGADPLVANRTSCGGAWETVSIINNSDGSISLKSAANDLYVCAVIDENSQLVARSSEIGTWEKFYLVDAGDGKYGLMAAANNLYVCADFNNGGQLRAISESVAGSWEAFAIRSIGEAGSYNAAGGVTMYTDSNYNGTAVTFGIGEYNMSDMINAGIPNDSVSSIKVPSGYKVVVYADINFGGNNTVFTGDTTYVGSGWNDGITSFKVMDANAAYGGLSDGNYYFSANNSDGTEYVVCAENTGADPLIANRSSCGGAWETLTIVNNSDGTISLQSQANGLYVCAVIDENCQLLARSSSISTWEKFYLELNSDGTYSLKAVANDKYVCADFNNGGQLRAISDSVAGSWEAFHIYSLN